MYRFILFFLTFSSFLCAESPKEFILFENDDYLSRGPYGIHFIEGHKYRPHVLEHDPDCDCHFNVKMDEKSDDLMYIEKDDHIWEIALLRHYKKCRCNEKYNIR